MYTILIDGASGSGKSTLATALGESLGWPVVRADSFYPGWSGLAQAAHIIAEQVLALHAPGYPEWDWQAGAVSGWRPVPLDNLIVEGTGSVTEATVAAAKGRGEVLTVRLTGEVALRRSRALAREPYFSQWWDMWAAQEKLHFEGPGKIPVDLELAATTPTAEQVAAVLAGLAGR